MWSNPLPGLEHDVHKALARWRLRAAENLPTMPSLGGVRTLAWVAAGLLLVALIYLAQSSNAALTARTLRVKQLRLEELDRDNSQLRFEIATATSASSISERAKKLGLGPAKAVVYATMPQLQVDLADVMPAFAPYQKTVAIPRIASNDSALNQFLTLLGITDATDRAQAQSK